MKYNGHLHYVRIPQQKPPKPPYMLDWKGRPLTFVALDDDRYAKVKRLAEAAGMSVRRYVFQRLRRYHFKPIWEEEEDALDEK